MSVAEGDTERSADGSSTKVTNLEEFVALVAHEVRTPLAIAKSATQSILDHGNDADMVMGIERRADLLHMIDRNIDLAVLLLDRMSLARSIEEDKVELSTEVIDFAQLVDQSVGDLREIVLREHPVEVRSVERLDVKVDATAAREIVFNLLSNAAKYSAPDAPIEVIVHARDDRVEMIVRNHGGGVTPGDTDRIFGKFFQLDEGASGVGLGLFISRGLARAHGGDIRVRPAAERGSEFVLDLPRHVE